MFVEKDYNVGDLVWAKMKGYPPWPARIAERTKPPLKKKFQHFVYFFGTKNFSWISDEYITPHSQNKIDFYDNKKTLPALRLAINEIAECSESLPPTYGEYKSSDDEEVQISNEAAKISDDSESSSSDDMAAVLMTRNDESLKPGPSKSTTKGSAMKYNKRRVSLNRKQSRFKKGYFGIKDVQFKTNLKSKAKNAPQPDKNLKPQKPETAVLSDKNLADDDANDSDYIMVETEDEAVPKEGENKGISLPTTPPPPPRPPRTYMPATTKKIGFLGLGMMGLTIVKHLLKSNHNVTVWDRNVRDVIDTEIQGAKEGLSASDVTEQCDIIFSCFYKADVAKFTVFEEDTGVLHGLGGCDGTKCYVEMTSISNHASRDIAKYVNQKGATYLEAQINGSLDIAELGEVIIFASGDEAVYDSCISVFDSFSTRYYYIGAEVGAATGLNVLCNMLSGCVSAALAEGMSLATQMKLSLIDVMTGLNMCDFSCPIIEEQGRAIVYNTFNTSYFLKSQQRDMNLGLRMGDEVNNVMPVTAAANATLLHAKRLNFGAKDSSVLYMASKRAEIEKNKVIAQLRPKGAGFTIFSKKKTFVYRPDKRLPWVAIGTFQKITCYFGDLKAECEWLIKYVDTQVMPYFAMELDKEQANERKAFFMFRNMQFLFNLKNRQQKMLFC